MPALPSNQTCLGLESMMELRWWELAASHHATAIIALAKSRLRQAEDPGDYDIRFGSQADIQIGEQNIA
jgi:hypothetical protein